MKLSEIAKVPQQTQSGFDLKDFDLESATQVTTAENIPVFYIKGGPKDPSLEMYALKIDDQYVSVLIGRTQNLDKPSFVILRSYTIPSMRNRGLVTALYKTLYSRLHLRLVGDFEMSPETIKVWTKLATEIPVKVYDEENKQILKLTDVSDRDLYDPDQKMRLITESRAISELEILMNRPLLGGILRDYIHYTSEELRGQFP